MFIAIRFTSLPAPAGAERKLNAKRHIALRWSAELGCQAINIGAPLEHFGVDN